MRIKQEIPQEELIRYAAELRELAETLCASAAFKTSPKSCQFLRYIVENTLGGNVDVLKERLIGITLLGRSASYDTAADAGVRVRANDVRKRLAAHAEAEPQPLDGEFSIEVPPGAYVPRFFRWLKMQEEHKPAPALPEAPRPVVVRVNQVPRLSLYWLSVPTVAALFLCTIFMRWRMNEEHPTNIVQHHDFQSHTLPAPPAPTSP